MKYSIKNGVTLALLTSFLWLVMSPTLLHATQFKGRLEWLHTVELRVLESGIITKMNVTVGQFVKKGDVLLQMDSREAKAKLKAADARVARAAINTADALREHGRTEELYERALIADEELKDSELKKAIAIADEASAKATQAIVKIALERTALRAPFPAIIINHNVWEGDVIYKTLQQTPPLTIAPSNQMLARVLVTAPVLNRYRKGQPATVTLQGKHYKGKIYSLGVESVRIDTNGAVYELDVIFNKGNKEMLRQAQVVQVNLP